ncbi:MAG: hypothetical protein LBG42_01575, partial [Treponema sp.]|nr:hypothetical protein [Treponema sp.]
EIYCTGRGHTPIQKAAYNIFGGGKFSGASSGVWTPASNQHAALNRPLEFYAVFVQKECGRRPDVFARVISP